MINVSQMKISLGKIVYVEYNKGVDLVCFGESGQWPKFFF